MEELEGRFQYRKALKYRKENHDIQISLFLQVCGPELKSAYKTLQFPTPAEGAELTIEQVLATCDDHLKDTQI